MEKYPGECKLDKCMTDMCPSECQYLMKCAVKNTNGTMDRSKCKEEFDKLPETLKHCKNHMACWWNSIEYKH